jgi:hypothetical protein
MMRSICWGFLLAGIMLGTAHANVCYFVYDRGDNVVYRDHQPPVDMSDRGQASRDALRQRGDYLLFVDTDACAPIAFLTGPGTPGTLSVDQVVAGFPTMATADPNSSPISRRPASAGAATKASPAARATSSAPAYRK